MMTKRSLTYILLKSETSAIRFWFGLATIFFGIFLLANPQSQWEYVITYIILPHWVWGIGFLMTGSAMLYGSLASKLSTLSMFFEGILGTILWVGVAVSSMMSQGSPGAVTIAALMSVWLAIRYPSWSGCQ